MDGHIRMRKLKDGSMRWDCMFTPTGQKQRSKTFKSEREAKRWVKRLTVAIEDGDYKTLRPIAWTKLVDLYASDMKRRMVEGDLQPSTYRSYVPVVTALGTHPAFEALTTAMITKDVIEAWRNGMVDLVASGKLAKKTLRHREVRLGAILKFARESRYMQANPMKAVRKTKVDLPDIDICSAEDYKLLIKNAVDRATRLMLMVTFASGIRRGELCALTREDINLDGSIQVGHSMWRTIRKCTKSDEPRSTILNRNVAAELKSWMDDATDKSPGAPLFPNSIGKFRDPDALSTRKIAPTFKAAGIDG